jgi:hypothetical protein
VAAELDEGDLDERVSTYFGFLGCLILRLVNNPGGTLTNGRF